MRLTIANFLAACLTAAPVCAQINAGVEPAAKSPDFTVTTVATFDKPWKLAFLPDGGMLVTEKPGALWLVDGSGAKRKVAGVPAVKFQGQQGLLGVFVSPTYARGHDVYLTYAEPGDGGSSLAVARARLTLGTEPRLDGLKVIWRELPKGDGGQLGAIIAFAPDGKSMFLSVGERQRFTPAQDPNSALGKILHLTLDGKPAAGNPWAGKTGAKVVPLFAPPKDTEAEKTVAKQMVTLPGPNLVPSETWAMGFRTPYGLAFDKQGRLWEVEHGPRGGDELNLIEKGKNYGWPLVSYGMNYDAVPIPSHDTRPEFVKPLVYWTPVIAPGGLAFYDGAMFPEWRGSAFIGGMASQTLNRVVFDGKGGAKPADRWSMGKRIRDVEVGPDGALWLLEDATPGALMKVTRK